VNDFFTEFRGSFFAAGARLMRIKKSFSWGLIGIILILTGCQSAELEPETEASVPRVAATSEGEKIKATQSGASESTPKPTILPNVDENERCCDVFRIGIFEEPESLNYWNYLGPGSSVWTGYIVSNDAGHLFELSDQFFQFVPSLAINIPTPQQTNTGTWEIVVEMVPDALWSDGIPLTAHDVVFTHTVCKDLQLNWYWEELCKPDGIEIDVIALSDYQVQYSFHDQAPTLKTWQYGIALAPILPQHFWKDIVSDANEMVQKVIRPVDGRPDYCAALKITPVEQNLCDDWEAYELAYELARQVLYTTAVQDYPVAGGYQLSEWLPGKRIRMAPNDNYYFRNAVITGYENGAWSRQLPNGIENILYGAPTDDPLWLYQDKAFNSALEYVIFGSQEAAIQALERGEVDFVLNPIRLSQTLIEQLRGVETLIEIANSANDMFYLAFNTRTYPLSAYEFRQVFDILIDREWIISEILEDIVQPLYTSVPPNNSFWHHPDIPAPYQNLSRTERVSLAIQTLKDAGWRWTSEPTWDSDTQAIVPGDGLIMPTGEPMPAITILGPGPEFDLVRATFNHWIVEWARDLGMPVQSELTNRNAILDSVFIAADYDIYIFGTSLGNPAYPEYFETFWHSRNCTFETGGLNTTCFKNTDFDSLSNDFLLASDLNAARELGFKMQILLADQRPFIPLYSEKVFEFVSPKVEFPYTEALNGIEFQNGFQTGVQVLFSK
jgi:peptide/nickel transport system substrate-binding protein